MNNIDERLDDNGGELLDTSEMSEIIGVTLFALLCFFFGVYAGYSVGVSKVIA